MSSVGATPSLDALAWRYLAALLAGDRREAVRIILQEGWRRGVSAPQLELGVIAVAQRELGRLWEEARITIAEEHLATSISELALATLYDHLPRRPRIIRRAIVACVEGERHSLGGRITADFLEMAGFDVRFLGSDVPTESLLAMVETTRPDVVALSATMALHIPAVEGAVTGVRRIGGAKMPLLLGGGLTAWAPELEGRLDVTVFGGAPDAAAEAARRAFG